MRDGILYAKETGASYFQAFFLSVCCFYKTHKSRRDFPQSIALQRQIKKKHKRSVDFLDEKVFKLMKR